MSGSLIRITRQALKHVIKSPTVANHAPLEGVLAETASMPAREVQFDFHRVPDEIIDIILGYLRPGHLCEIVKVSKTFHEVGLKVLYRFIYIHHSHRAIAFYRTIFQDHPEYAIYIREFRISERLEVTCNPKKICRGSGEYVYKVFKMSTSVLQGKVLAMAVNLVSLEMELFPLVPFRDEGPPSPNDWRRDPFGHVRWLLDGKVRLKRLIVHPQRTSRTRDDPTHADEHRFLATILRAQPTLEHLELSFVPHTLSPLDLPQLQSFTSGEPAYVRFLSMRERPLRKIGYTRARRGCIGELAKYVDLKQGGEQVLELCWQFSGHSYWGKTDLEYIPSTFPQLRVLRLRLRVLEFDTLMRDILSILHKFTRLVELDLGASGRYDGRTAFSDPTFTDESLNISSDMSLVASFQTRCPSLLRITLANHRYWFRNRVSETWTCASPIEAHREHWLLYGEINLPYAPGVSCVSVGDVMNHP